MDRREGPQVERHGLETCDDLETLGVNVPREAVEDVVASENLLGEAHILFLQCPHALHDCILGQIPQLEKIRLKAFQFRIESLRMFMESMEFSPFCRAPSGIAANGAPYGRPGSSRNARDVVLGSAILGRREDLLGGPHLDGLSHEEETGHVGDAAACCMLCVTMTTV